jgi:hypothetical protein
MSYALAQLIGSSFKIHSRDPDVCKSIDNWRAVNHSAYIGIPKGDLKMNRVPLARRIQIINCLVKGNSIRSTERMTGTHRDTICRLLVEVGEGCAKTHGRANARVAVPSDRG